MLALYKDMKIQPDRAEGRNQITRMEDQAIWVNHQAFHTSILIPHEAPVQVWSAKTVESLTPSDMEALIALRPELIILGTGSILSFPDSALIARIYQAGIGFEAMSTPAACRTFNVLVSEGRQVLGAMMW
jgi:uncharacterized protein